MEAGQFRHLEQTCPGTKQPVSPENDAWEGAEMKCKGVGQGWGGGVQIGRKRDTESGRKG